MYYNLNRRGGNNTKGGRGINTKGGRDNRNNQ